MKLIVGLGNPGPEYEATRHNAGFLVVQALAEAHGVALTQRLTAAGPASCGTLTRPISERPRNAGRDKRPASPARIVPARSQGRRLFARWGEWRPAAGDAVRLLLPQTMMNLSGEALQAAAPWSVAPSDTLIVCDDANVPLGRLRVRPQGSDGGQHGLASCLAALGTEEVPRLRIGIGCEPLPKDLTEYVLSPFGSSEQPVLRRMLAQAVEACEWWAAEGIDAAMNRVNPDTNC